MMKAVKFQSPAYQDFCCWASENLKLFNIINELVKEISRTPYIGKGKPEPLKHEFSGCWSRRISEEHRLVYKVTESEIIIYSCKGHYS